MAPIETVPATIVDLPALLATLAERGWTTLSAVRPDAGGIIGELGGLGDILGVVPAALSKKSSSPNDRARRIQRSLSARFTLNALPFQAELSHRPRHRFEIMACTEEFANSASNEAGCLRQLQQKFHNIQRASLNQWD